MIFFFVNLIYWFIFFLRIFSFIFTQLEETCELRRIKDYNSECLCESKQLRNFWTKNRCFNEFFCRILRCLKMKKWNFLNYLKSKLYESVVLWISFYEREGFLVKFHYHHHNRSIWMTWKTFFFFILLIDMYVFSVCWYYIQIILFIWSLKVSVMWTKL